MAVKTVDYQFAKKEFLRHLTVRGFKRKTLEAYGYILDHLFGFLREQKDRSDLRAVTKQDLTAYEEFIIQDKKTPETRKTYLRRIFFFFRFFSKEGFLLIDPSESLTLHSKETHRRVPEILTEQEIKSILALPFERHRLGKRDRAVLELIYSTGLRVSEVASLQIADIDGDEKIVLVRQGKGQKDRVVPMGERALAAIRDYRENLWQKLNQGHRGELFFSYSGRLLDKNSLAALLRKYAHLCGLTKRIYPHLIRHTMATHLLEHGAPLPAVQGILGHSRLETTQLYTQVKPAELKRWVKKCHPLGRGSWIVDRELRSAISD